MVCMFTLKASLKRSQKELSNGKSNKFRAKEITNSR